MNIEAFNRKLAKLKVENPFHDIIPVIEELGPTHLAYEYLVIALEDKPTVDVKEYTANTLFRTRDHLYSKRGQLSNKFIECVDDAARAAVSISIGSLQAEIIENRKLISQYLETGKLPSMEEVKKAVPMDGRAKEKKLRSVRSSIWRFETELRESTDEVRIQDIKDKLALLYCERDELSS